MSVHAFSIHMSIDRLKAFVTNDILFCHLEIANGVPSSERKADGSLAFLVGLVHVFIVSECNCIYCGYLHDFCHLINIETQRYLCNDWKQWMNGCCDLCVFHVVKHCSFTISDIICCH